MKRLKFILFSLLMLLCLLCSCEKVHEFPESGHEIDPTDIETKIDVRCAIELAGRDIITRSVFDNLLPEQEAPEYNRRFIVKIYSDEYSDELVDSRIVYKEVMDMSDLIVETKLHTKKYKIAVWMDYVKKGTATDLYYLTSNGENLNAIHQPSASAYVACSDFKDARTFTSNIDLTPYAGQWYANITIPAPLERPVAKITILANDLDKYAEQIGYHGSLEDLAGDMTLEIYYDGYYPTGYNAFTGRLNDSQTGYGFKSGASFPYTLEQKDYTRVGYDYVFVNGESSSVTITVRIKSKNGQFINEVNNVLVPITRGRETVIIFKFFTKEYVPGIGIDPGFDGEFNVYV